MHLYPRPDIGNMSDCVRLTSHSVVSDDSGGETQKS
jgi:hypothetical protein